MSLKVYEEEHIRNAINAVREKTGKTDPMTVSQLAEEIAGIEVGSNGSGIKLLHDWDFTDGLIDMISSQKATISSFAVDSGGSGATPTRDSNGVTLNGESQYIYLGDIDLVGKVIEIDVANFEFVGNLNYHIRFLMCTSSTEMNNDTIGSGPLIWRKSNTIGWSSYSKKVFDDGCSDYRWASKVYGNLSGSDDTIVNYFNGKTIQMYISAGGTPTLYVDGIKIGSGDAYITHDLRNIYIGGIPGQYIGADNGNQCYNVTVSGVRIYDISGTVETSTDINDISNSPLYFGETAPEDNGKTWVKTKTPESVCIVDELVINTDLQEDYAYLDRPIEIHDSIAVVGDKVYIICGYNNGFLSDIRCFNPSTKAIKIVGDLGDALNAAMATAIGDKIYVFGGWSATRNCISDRIYCYDTSNNTVRILNATITARENGSAVVYKNKIYILGGFTGSTYTMPIEIFDIDTETVTTLNVNTPNGRGARSTVINDRIYYVGAHYSSYGTDCTRIISVFNPYDNTFTNMSINPSRALGCRGVSSIDNLLYLIGGRMYDHSPSQTIEVINVDTGEIYTLQEQLTDGLYAMGIAKIDDTFYIVGGNEASATTVANIHRLYGTPQVTPSTLYVLTSKAGNGVTANVGVLSNGASISVNIASVYDIDTDGNRTQVEVLQYTFDEWQVVC